MHPHADHVALGAGLDDLEVGTGHLLAEPLQVDDVDLVDTHHGVRVAGVEVQHRSVGVAPDRGPSLGFAAGPDLAHVDARVDRVVAVGGGEPHQSVAGIGEDALRVEVTATHRDRLREAADAVAAHLRATAVGVVQHHARRVAGRVGGHEQPVGADAGAAVAQCHGELGETIGLDRRVEHHEEVVAESVVLGELQRGHVGPAWSAASASAITGTASATGSSPMSSQRTRGSRRNHRS